MPQGYYTVEQWTARTNHGQPAWTPILHLPFGASLTAAEEALAKLGRPGFYRLGQMQRGIWAEQDGDTIRLRKAHAGSPQGLDEMRQMFERCDGRYPLEEVRETRRQAK